MRLSTSLFAASTIAAANAQAPVVTGQLGDAVKVLNDPMGAAYQAVIPKGVYGTITGSMVAVSAGDSGTEFAVDFAGLPSEGGPFVYHIHVMPVPSGGNCTDTLAHLDPYIRGEVDPCTMDRPETCQVGDLAGKHGKVNGTSFQRTFSDPYVSLIEGQGSFFGNRSFVIHFANKTRIACANFQSISNAQGPGLIGMNSSTPLGPEGPVATLVPQPRPNPPNAAVTTTATSIPYMPEPSSKPLGGTEIKVSAATRTQFVSGVLLLAPLGLGLVTLL